MLPAPLVVDNGKLDKIEENLTDQEKKTFDALATKYKWSFIVFAVIFTLMALMSFFG